MPFALIPYGKGTGKFWLIVIGVIIILFLIYNGYEDIAIRINNGQTVNPTMLFIARLFYPIYASSIWLLNFLRKWGIFALIPAVIIGVILTNVWEKIVKFANKAKDRK